MTAELLQAIYKRIEEVYFAKTNYKPDTIQLLSDGTFYCSTTHDLAYGNTEVDFEIISAEDLTDNLDRLIEIREQKEAEKIIRQAKTNEDNEKRYKEEERSKRLMQYNKLKKEFEGNEESLTSQVNKLREMIKEFQTLKIL
jgi:hypothetical protein